MVEVGFIVIPSLFLAFGLITLIKPKLILNRMAGSPNVDRLWTAATGVLMVLIASTVLVGVILSYFTE